MNKTRSAEVLSLDTTKQKDVVKETKQLKKDIKDGIITLKGAKKIKKVTEEQRRGLIFISHLPHGFYEEELKKYFQQFGKVTNVKVCRSGKTGNSKGYGYVEFLNSVVAKIAAETMNNYLMFKKRITANFVPHEKRPKGLFTGKSNTPTRFSSKVRRNKQINVNSTIDSKTHLKRTTTRLSKLKKKLTLLKNMGANCTYTPIDITVIKQETSSDISNNNKSDPFDSVLEEKKPIKNSKTEIKSDKMLPTVSHTYVTRKQKKGLVESDALHSDLLISNNASVNNGKQIKSKKQSKTTKNISKQPGPLNAETVKKIARELIRKRGDSLLTHPVEVKSKIKGTKKKSSGI